MKPKYMRLGVSLLVIAVLLVVQSVAQNTSGGGTQSTNTGNVRTPDTAPAEPAHPSATPLEPTGSGEPHTEMLDTANGPASHDPLLEPRPLPRANLSLIGGTVRKVDIVHNRITLQPFGGGNKYQVNFDERTRILSGGRETTALAIHPGDHIYVDTQSLGSQVFASIIQVRGAGGQARASGQVIDMIGGQVHLQDRSSGEAIRFVISDRTKVQTRSGPVSAAELRPGSLIDVTFTPNGLRSEAQSVTIYASPGQHYVFEGILTDVDLRDGVLAMDNLVDGNNYELYFDPLGEKNVSRLLVGTPVSVTASFDGKRYQATAIKINEAATNSDSDK
jgi:hypothetical protein